MIIVLEIWEFGSACKNKQTNFRKNLLFDRSSDKSVKCEKIFA